MNRLTFIHIQEVLRNMKLMIVTGREDMSVEQREDLADELTSLAQLVRPEETPAPPVAEGELTIEAAQRSMGGQDG